MLNMLNVSHVIKLALTSLHEGSFMVKTLEKWDIFNFSDFDRDLPIFQF